MSFALKAIEKEGGEIRFIVSHEQGKPCWCYLRVDPTKWQSYKQALRQKIMNIRDFGEILKTGWGDYPPASIVALMRSEYDFDTPIRKSGNNV